MVPLLIFLLVLRDLLLQLLIYFVPIALLLGRGGIHALLRLGLNNLGGHLFLVLRLLRLCLCIRLFQPGPGLVALLFLQKDLNLRKVHQDLRLLRNDLIEKVKRQLEIIALRNREAHLNFFRLNTALEFFSLVQGVVDVNPHLVLGLVPRVYDFAGAAELACLDHVRGLALLCRAGFLLLDLDFRAGLLRLFRCLLCLSLRLLLINLLSDLVFQLVLQVLVVDLRLAFLNPHFNLFLDQSRIPSQLLQGLLEVNQRRLELALQELADASSEIALISLLVHDDGIFALLHSELQAMQRGQGDDLFNQNLIYLFLCQNDRVLLDGGLEVPTDLGKVGRENLIFEICIHCSSN